MRRRVVFRPRLLRTFIPGKDEGRTASAVRLCLRMVLLTCAALAISVAANAQSLDDAFTPGLNGSVSALRLQPDGKILVAGTFSGGITRLNPDGSLDTTFFQQTATDYQVSAIALQADGRILIGGGFTRVRTRLDKWVTRRGIARLNADGTLDTGFDPSTNGQVLALAVQADGKILVGGDFVELGRGSEGRLHCLWFGRLNADGSRDTAFKVQPSRPVYAIAVQPDGKILLGGSFETVVGGGSTIGGQGIARLNPDGTVDAAFEVGVWDGDWGTYKVRAFVVQPDGKVIAGGHFRKAKGVDAPDGLVRHHIVRFNADGSIDRGFSPTVDDDGWYDTVRALALQADGKLVVGGNIVKAGNPPTTPRNHLARFNLDGSLDSSFNPGADRYVNALVQQADGKILVGGEFTRIGGGSDGHAERHYLARLNADGLAQPDTVLDTSYNPGAGPAASIPREVLALALQANGQIVVGGGFTMLGGGGTGTTPRNYIGRLNADGSLDTTFNPGANAGVNALLVEPDGKIVVGGAFTTLGGGGTGTTTRNGGIGRLHADGSIDTTFNPNKTGYINTLARQADGKIIAGGAENFGSFSQVINWIGRLNANGSVDTTFAPNANDVVFAVAVQPADGKILVGGRFSTLGGGGTTPRSKIGRLNADGTIDTTFNPGANSEIYAVAVQPDGKILIGGGFTLVGAGAISAGTGATQRNNIARLNTDGSVDTTFNPGANGPVYSLVVQPDGKILVGGAFNRLGTATLIGSTGTRERLGRLNADGSVDTTFNPGADWNVKAFVVQGDGKIVVGGGFSKLGGGGAGTIARSHIGRLMLASPPTGVSTGNVTTGSAKAMTIETPLGPIGLTFSSVTTAGKVSVWNVAANPQDLKRAPAGFKLLDMVNFDVTTTAGFTAADLCVPYSSARVAEMRLNEATLRLFHIPDDGTAWADVTKQLDTAADRICGSVTHFSTFAIAGQETSISRYLAEGATSTFFDTRLALLNPGATDATATLTFAKSGGSTVVHSVPVPARRRVTLDPKSIAGLADAAFSTKIESNQLLVVDRTMSWDRNGYGAHAETSVVNPEQTWYLAEGSTNGFNLFYLLQNPNDEEAEVVVRYLRPSGAPLVKTYRLPPTSRTNIWVNHEVFDGLGKALSSSDVSAVVDVTNSLEIIVERAMYLDALGQGFAAGHESAGVTTPATQWFLAEGATGPSFDLFVLVANPGGTDAQVEASYLLPDGTVIVKPYTVPANSRFNIWVDFEAPRLLDTAVSTTIRSTNDVPIIVERAMWWPGSGWYEAHNSAGATTTGTRWALAEGEVGGPRGVATYILVANTSAAQASIKVTVLFENGTSREKTFLVNPRSRFNVDVGFEFPDARNQRFGAIVESLGTTPAQLVVERAMYWDASGQGWAAGTNALATKLQ